MRVLVTGGAGYIGSHTVLALLRAGYSVVVVDNLSNSRVESLQRVAALAGRQPDFVRADITDKAALEAVFRRYPDVSAVLHFAGLKAVGESVAQPLAYYRNNVVGTMVLCEVMQAHGVQRMVFSSSATVYGDAKTVPVPESEPLKPTNPYGHTKRVIEELLADVQQANPGWRVGILRYFNPVGADESGQIGEDPQGVPNNLMPYITQVAVGRLESLQVFGDDYPTIDGTGVRDYIHVSDLAAGHLAALRALEQVEGVRAWNLGTGQGYSVLELVAAFERVTGKKIPYTVVGRRAGDVATSYADVTRASGELGWSAQLGLDRMVSDAWRWQRTNPDGYDKG
ncbi:MAG: UDP-glucose 4-epimerase GalE [Gammaproteobacteria bacterium]|nr:MAG: UDP-glucose 4-epimerase GalE [Gammaproteobacteria bacterium]